MYFHDRGEAGKLLAKQLAPYRYENCAVLALSPGGVLVGEQIARELHCGLSMLLTAQITAPGEASLILGTIDHLGNFSYNNLISPGQMEEYLEDSRTYLEEEKMRRIFAMSTLLGQGGLSQPHLLAGRNVIIATDGVKTGLSYEAAFAYLKYIPTERLIAAIPVGTADVIDRLHERCYEVDYLYIPNNFVSVGHYYEENRPQSVDEVVDRIDKIVTHWV